MNQASVHPDHGVRAAAFALVRDALSKERRSEGEWTDHPEFQKLEGQPRATCLNLSLTVLRHLGSIDTLLAARMTKQPKGSHRAVLHLLRLGTAELLWLNTPAYAAVNAYVELARKQGFEGMTGFVNAILKRIGESGADALARIDLAKLDTPVWLWQRWQQAYGEEQVRKIAAMHAREPALDISVAQDAAHWATLLPAEPLPTGSLRRARAGRVRELPGFEAGAWWVQDAAAALPVRLFAALPGATALDMCAAPGGKTAQLCAAGATVTALDHAPARLTRLQRNLERLRMQAHTVETDALDFAPATGFDRVLLDAPCSATGTIRRHPEIAWMRTAQDINRLSAIQSALLEHAARLTLPGGQLVYATCSLEPEEGERQIERFLHDHPEFRTMPVDAAALGIPAHWVDPQGRLRILPCYWEERGGLDGFFACRMDKHA